MLQKHFLDTQLAKGVEFDSVVDGVSKSFTVRDIVCTDNCTLAVEAEDSDGNIESFFDVPVAFFN